MLSALSRELRNHFENGISRSVKWRIGQLQQLAKLLTENSRSFEEAVAADLGKCAFETQTTEVALVLAELKHACRHLGHWVKPRSVATPLLTKLSSASVVPEPKGVVLIIGAWNYPIQLIAAPLLAAIAAGNVAVVKPSELAPQTSHLWADLLPRYLDAKSYAVAEGGADVTSVLLAQEFDHIFFTGGGRVARIVAAAAAQHLTPVTLELGGKSPCIVSRDADIKATARRVIWGKFLNAGQTCIAPDYLLADAAIVRPLLNALKDQLREFFGENAALANDYGRIVNEAHFDRLMGLLCDARIVHGGQSDRVARYIDPTLVLDPDPNSPLMQEEIFGPILPVIAVRDAAAAVAFVNRRPKPLALYVFSKSRSTTDSIVNNTSAGNVCINDTMMFMAVPALPFGGVGDSGIGNYHGRYGFETFSHMKAVLRRSLWPDPNWRYPPYSRRKLRILKALW